MRLSDQWSHSFIVQSIKTNSEQNVLRRHLAITLDVLTALPILWSPQAGKRSRKLMTKDHLNLLKASFDGVPTDRTKVCFYSPH